MRVYRGIDALCQMLESERAASRKMKADGYSEAEQAQRLENVAALESVIQDKLLEVQTIINRKVKS